MENLATDVIDPNPNQPRRTFDEQALAGLADSIRAHGVLQPIIVRRNGERFQIVAGERRLKAAGLAGLASVPVVVREFSDAEVAEIALVENLQREDLNPLEEAEALRRLIDEFGLTQEELAEHLGRSRPAITNALRLLQAGEPVREALWRRELTAGHARALLPVTDVARQREAVERIRVRGLSVRDTERLARKLQAPARPRAAGRGASGARPEWRAAEERLREALGTRVQIRGDTREGVIEIRYLGADDLERLLELLGRR